LINQWRREYNHLDPWTKNNRLPVTEAILAGILA
jgi:hypothetical protein